MIKKNAVRWYTRSFASKAVLFVSLLIIAIIAVQTFVFIHTETTYLQDHLIEDKRSSAELLAINLGVAQTVAGFAFQSNLIEEAGKTGDTVYVRFVKPNGEIYLSNIVEERGAFITDPAINTDRTAVRDDIYDSESIKVAVSPASGGYTVWLGFSLDRVHAAVNERVRDILLVSLAILIIVNFIAYFIAKRITQPLKELREGVEAIGKGNLDYKVDVKSQDEIGELAKAFNKMADDLQKTTVSKEYVDNIIGSMLDALIVVDPEAKIMKVNKSTCELLGYKEEELVGKPVGTFFAKAETPFKGTELEKLIEQGQLRNYETDLKAKDGKTIPVLLGGSVVKDKDGNMTYMVYTAKDITKRKQAEKREQQLQQELNRASRMASIGELAAGVAHEINNPLTGVIGFSQLLISRDIPADIRKDLKVINSEAQRVAKIVENLLIFAHQSEPGREYININHIISSVLELRSYEMKVHNIEVVPRFAPDLPCTMADASQLQQVFLNIITNAEKEMIKAHNKGKLLVRTEKIGDNIRASFTDDGPGISKENLDRIFDPFFTTREVGDGTGLGLSICHGIIAQHKGRIYADSKLGKGATFVVELPIVANTGQTEKTEVIEEEPWQQRGAKILVVDDETCILNFLKRVLTEQGYQVETVDRAHKALERLNSEKYDLILLDIKLPGMSGIELYRRIQAMDPALAQRVMFITGDVMEKTTRDFFAQTKVPHIAKPFNIEQLKRDINSILTREQVRQR